MKIKGIDVSRWQGNIDWNKVKSSGISFAILKAGGSDDGFYQDLKFEEYYRNAKAVGVHVGAYYFVGAGCISYDDGVADAKRFLDIIKGKQFEYPVFIDVEATAPSNRSGATKATIGFCETMQNAGYYCGIYASDVSGFVDRLDQTQLRAYDKWVARYGSSPPSCTDNYGMWQYSDSGSVAGISGNVDLDCCYADYPKIIKEKCLNGFKTKTQETERVDDTITVKLKKLCVGSSGSAVKNMQSLLICHGYLCGTAGADGKFGSDTESAVKAFQQANSLDVDGICGPATWSELLR